MSHYQIELNRKLRCRELIDTTTGAVIDSADLEDSRANVQLTMRCEELNAKAAAAELASIEAEASLVETAETFAPALALHYGAPVLVEAAPLVTRAAVGQALKQARELAAADKAWTNAINKAVIELEAQPWAFDGSTLVIRSRSDSTAKHTTDGSSCTCKAFNREQPIPCWHRAAHRILVRAAALISKPTPRKPAYRPSTTYQTARAA